MPNKFIPRTIIRMKKFEPITKDKIPNKHIEGKTISVIQDNCKCSLAK